MKAADVLRASAASLLSSSESLDRAVSEVEAMAEPQEFVNGSSASSPYDSQSLSFEDLAVQVLANHVIPSFADILDWEAQLPHMVILESGPGQITLDWGVF